MSSLEELGQRISTIEGRNKKVEKDKAWETSWTRKFVIALFTYLAVGFYMNSINIDRPWLNAIIPSIAFLLSTLTLPFIKKTWIKYSPSKE
ncbi:hypothetical protein HYU93_03525 [Candidatus Daviesbacteria bacterium]|nr:hypothetical protein [Candidatus Daviesbacteria bacterium]